MALENKGKYVVVLDNETGKYVIQYVERGNIIVLDKFIFGDYDRAEEFIKTNQKDLDETVTAFKEEEQRKIEEEQKRKEEEEAEKKRKEEEKAAKKKKFAYDSKRYIAGAVAAAVLLTGGHFLGSGIAKLGRNKGTGNNTSISQTIVNRDEELNNENFEKLATEFTKQYTDKKVNVSTEDLVKFVSILNIDRLLEENPELAKELFSTQTAEEYLSDAAKVIGMTYTYNRNVFETEQSTKNFIRISSGVNGQQKEVLQKIESYVDRVAETKNDADKCNEVISEFLVFLGDPTNEMSYLDDGVGFGMQVSVELIRSYLAKDVINKQNLDYLTVLTSSEEYVSNIFTQYKGCTDVKTKTKTN